MILSKFVVRLFYSTDDMYVWYPYWVLMLLFILASAS